ncbi:MAG: hypothetical protein ACLRM9_01720 [Collinsella aerofaciens]
METTARGDVPKTLQTIAYISIPNSADLEFLLWDLQDAIAAYAQLSGTALPRPVDLEADDAGVVDGMVLAVDDAFDDEAMIAVEEILNRFGNTETRIYVVVQARPKTTSRRTKSSTAYTGHVFYVTYHGVTVLSSVPAAASQRFVALRAWDSCGDRFRKRWISLWALCAWAAPSSMHSDLAAAMPPTSTPTAWFAPSQPCPRRSGEAF